MNRAGLGRAMFAVGLVVMLVGLMWGVSTDQLGVELGVAFVGFLLCMTGRSLSSKG